MLDYLKLVRYKNLLIIVLTQYLMRWCIIYSFERSVNLSLQFSEWNFFLLVMSTVFIAAAGYAINDYFDVKVDMENHPDSVVVGTRISRVKVMTLNNVLNLIGVLAGFWISYTIGLWKLGFIFLLTTGVLWFYSALFKRQLITGNLIVALFAALVPFLTIIYEIPLLNRLIFPDMSPVYPRMVSVMFLFVTGYSAFAFLTTFAREILKDIEDMEGDQRNFRNTIPIAWGVYRAKLLVILLLLIVIAALVFVYMRFFNDYYSVFYILFFIVIPVLYIIAKIAMAREKMHYRHISMALKGVMLSGLLFSILLYILI